MHDQSNIEEMILLHVDEKTNRLFFHRKLTNAVFLYQIEREYWEYICFFDQWADMAPLYGAIVKKKKRKKDG